MVYRAMLRQELCRPDFSKKYEYLKYRRILVDWMSEVGEEMQVRKETVHTAIAYLERVLAVRAFAFIIHTSYHDRETKCVLTRYGRSYLCRWGNCLRKTVSSCLR